MPVFTDALIGDTTHLSTEEFGAYCLILFATWRNNGTALPDDDRRLAYVCRVTGARWRKKLRPILVQFFELSDGTWHQKRLEKEWNYIKSKKQIAMNKGKSGARARWGGAPSDAKIRRTKRIADGEKHHTPQEWRLALEVFAARCLRCGAEPPEKDHVISLYAGGHDGIENLQPLCMKCNADKSSGADDYRDPKLLKLLIMRIAELSPEQCKGNGNTHTHKESPNGASSSAPNGAVPFPKEGNGKFVDPIKQALWRSARNLLSGIPEDRAGPIIGRWRKAVHDDNLLLGWISDALRN